MILLAITDARQVATIAASPVACQHLKEIRLRSATTVRRGDVWGAMFDLLDHATLIALDPGPLAWRELRRGLDGERGDT